MSVTRTFWVSSAQNAVTDQTVSIEIKAVKTAAPENDTQTQVKKEKKEEKVNSMISRLESDKLAAATVLAEVKATALSLNSKVIGLVVEECVSYISSTFPIFSVAVCVIISIMAASSSSCWWSVCVW